MQLELIDNVVDNVRAKLLERSKIGIRKYGTTLQQNNKDNYIEHAQMEAMDLCNYLEKLLIQKEDIKQIIQNYPNDEQLGEYIRAKYS
jgi:hypothetical protein